MYSPPLKYNDKVDASCVYKKCSIIAKNLKSMQMFKQFYQGRKFGKNFLPMKKWKISSNDSGHSPKNAKMNFDLPYKLNLELHTFLISNRARWCNNVLAIVSLT